VADVKVDVTGGRAVKADRGASALLAATTTTVRPAG
jgi:hypothetical protein